MNPPPDQADQKEDFIKETFLTKKNEQEGGPEMRPPLEDIPTQGGLPQERLVEGSQTFYTYLVPGNLLTYRS